MFALEIRPGMHIDMAHGGFHTVTEAARTPVAEQVYAEIVAEGWVPVTVAGGVGWIATEIVWDESYHVIHGDARVRAW